MAGKINLSQIVERFCVRLGSLILSLNSKDLWNFIAREEK